MGFLKGNLLFDRTRARVRRKPSSRRSGINPGANLDNGREELAFPAPGKPDSSSNGESDFTGHISPASSERVVPFRVQRPGSQAVSGPVPRCKSKWRETGKPAASRVTPQAVRCFGP